MKTTADLEANKITASVLLCVRTCVVYVVSRMTLCTRINVCIRMSCICKCVFLNTRCKIWIINTPVFSIFGRTLFGFVE